MAKAFVQVGVQVVASVTILVDKLAGGLVDDKFLVHAAAVCSLVVGISQVADGNAL